MTRVSSPALSNSQFPCESSAKFSLVVAPEECQNHRESHKHLCSLSDMACDPPHCRPNVANKRRCTIGRKWIFGPEVADFFRGLDPFPETLRLLRDPRPCSMKRLPQGDRCVWRALHVRSLHPLKAALPESTVAPFSRLFDQQAWLYIHKLTPLDLRSPALQCLLWMRNLRRFFWFGLGAQCCYRWGSWLMKVRGKLEAALLSALTDYWFGHQMWCVCLGATEVRGNDAQTTVYLFLHQAHYIYSTSAPFIE